MSQIFSSSIGLIGPSNINRNEYRVKIKCDIERLRNAQISNENRQLSNKCVEEIS